MPYQHANIKQTINCIRPELRRFVILWRRLRCGSCGGIQGVCNTPLQTAQSHNRSSFPKQAEKYIRCRKNYIGRRKNYIRHNSNYIRPFFATLQRPVNQKLTKLFDLHTNTWFSIPCKICLKSQKIRSKDCCHLLRIHAERGGFEPPKRFGRLHAFQACLFTHSSIFP